MNISSSTQSVLMGAIKSQPTSRQILPQSDSTETKRSESADSFLEFMKQTPEEQLQTAWLQRHGISKEQFAAMDATEKQKIVEQMKNEMKEQARNTAKGGARGSVANILA